MCNVWLTADACYIFNMYSLFRRNIPQALNLSEIFKVTLKTGGNVTEAVFKHLRFVPCRRSAKRFEWLTAWIGLNMKSLKAKFRKTDVSTQNICFWLYKLCVCACISPWVLWLTVCVCLAQGICEGSFWQDLSVLRPTATCSLLIEKEPNWGRRANGYCLLIMSV